MVILGGLFDPFGGTADETIARVRAAQAGWYSSLGFWTSRANFAVKRLIFIVKVYSRSISGLESYNFLAMDFAKIEIALCVFLRAMMKGTATDNTGLRPNSI